MNICVVSDSHDRAESLAAAINQAKGPGAQAVIHCGDLIGPNNIWFSIKLGVPLRVVHGHSLGDATTLHRMKSKSGGLITFHGQDAELDLAGRRHICDAFPPLWPGYCLYRRLRSGLLRPHPCRGNHPA